MFILYYFFLFSNILGLYEKEAGVIDWHQMHIGSIAGPSMISYSQRSVIVGSEAGLIGQVNLKTSEIEWRHTLGGSILQVYTMGSNSYTIASIGSPSNLERNSDSIDQNSWSIHAFSNQLGRPLFSNTIITPFNEKFLKITSKENYVYIVFSGSIYRYDVDGSLLFSYKFSSNINIGNILIRDEFIYVLCSEASRFSIKILNTKGMLLKDLKFSESHILGNHIAIVGTNHDFFAVFSSPTGPQITKIDQKASHIASLSQLLGHECDFVSLVFTREKFFSNYLIVKSKTSMFEVIKLSENMRTSIVHQFKKMLSKPFIQFSQISETLSAFSVVNKENDSIQIQVLLLDSDSETFKLSNHGFTGINMNYSGEMRWASIDYYNRKDVGILPRLIVGTEDGSFHCLKDSSILWTLEESLTETSCSLIVDLDKPASESKYWYNMKKESLPNLSLFSQFLIRIQRHAFLLTSYFPFLFTDFSKKNVHGFRKLAVFASKRGKLVGMDMESGKILWGKMFSHLSFSSLFLARKKSDVDSFSILTAVGSSKDSSHVFQLDLLTGKIYQDNQELIISAKNLKSSLSTIRQDRTNILANILVDSQGNTSIYPFSTDIVEKFSKLIENNGGYFYYSPGVGSNWLKGFSMIPRLQDKVFPSVMTWKLSLPNDEIIVAITAPENTPIASLGRVLGDRSVLYKYLNPNAISFLSVSKAHDGQGKMLHVYVLDVVTGDIILKQSRSYGGVAANHIHLSMSENFIIYSFWNEGPLKQNEIAVIELYEATTTDMKYSSKNISSFQKASHISAFEKTYILSQPVSSIGITSTKAGITSKEILDFPVAYRNGMLQGISRRLLDPRRPETALSSLDKEEGLVPYHPFLNIIPRDVATYFKNVFGIKSIKTLPTYLESTSVVVAYGVDIFFTRRMPSKPFDTLSDDFSYSQLIISILVLSFGVYYTGIQVQSKRIRESWS